MPEVSYQIIDWKDTPAAVWRPNQQALRAIRNIDSIDLDTLIGIDRQK